AGNIIGCLVWGLVPWRAGLAGVSLRVNFSRPGRVKTPGPFLASCFLIRSIRASKTSPICFLLRLVLVASSWKIADLVIDLALVLLTVAFFAMTPPCENGCGI